MELSIRRATPGDIPAMTELLERLFSIEKDFSPSPERQARGLGLMLESPEERNVVVAEAGGQVVGMVTGQLLVSTAEGGLVTLVEDMVIAPLFRGKGVGSRLLAEIECWAAELGSRRLQLLADRDNAPAKSFYERAGWRLTNLICFRKTEPGITLCTGHGVTRD